jgi:hypothetical protein
MKIHEILVESQQLDEGPLLNKIGSAIGKGVGTLAKGVGAVAGGVAGAGTAMKKGWDAGKAAVGRAGDDEPETAAPAAGAAAPAEKPAVGAAQPALTGGPTAGAAPAAEPVGGPTAQPAAGDVNKAGPAGTAAAKPLQGAAKVAADKTAAATAGQDSSAAGQTMYAQVKANIDKLDKKGKQRILQLLQKSMAAPAAKPAAGAAPVAAPAATPAPAAAEPTAPASAAPEAPAAEPTAAAPTAAPAAEPTAAPAPVAPKKTGGRVKGQLSQDPRAVKRRDANAAKTKQQAPASSQAEIDADRERIMGVTSDSIVRRQPVMAESFSLFRKRA